MSTSPWVFSFFFHTAEEINPRHMLFENEFLWGYSWVFPYRNHNHMVAYECFEDTLFALASTEAKRNPSICVAPCILTHNRGFDHKTTNESRGSSVSGSLAPFLGVPSPFFPGILLSSKPPEIRGKRQVSEQNGD